MTTSLKDVLRENIQSGVQQKVQKKLLEDQRSSCWAMRLKVVFRENIHSGVQQQSPKETSKRRTFVLLSSIKYSSSGSRRLNMDFDVLLPLGSLMLKKRVEGQDRHPGLMTGRREIRLEYILIWRLADSLSVNFIKKASQSCIVISIFSS